MTTILELTQMEGGGRETSISLLDSDGLVRFTVALEDSPFGSADRESAEKLADDAGWHTYGDWLVDGEFEWIQVVPKPLVLTFAGTELPDAQAVTYAQNAGYSVREVVSQDYDPSRGTTHIAFSVDQPYGWDWGKQLLEWDDEPL